jgi:TolA-binding protein
MMKHRLLITIALAGFVTMASAQDSGRGQSIMFENPPQDHSDLTTLPPGQRKKDLGERCDEMALEIKKLKGKPQQRSTMAERYRQECERP